MEERLTGFRGWTPLYIAMTLVTYSIEMNQTKPTRQGRLELANPGFRVPPFLKPGFLDARKSGLSGYGNDNA